MPETTGKTLAAFARQREQIDIALEAVLPPADLEPTELHQAMRYSVLAGGKRIRPILAVTSYHSSGGKSDKIFRHASALELLHTYSLIHDDLPCMDDDDFRRGKPTLHKQFSEYIAVLAGDALHALAFEVLAESGNCDVVLEVSRAIGTVGMIGGQVRDVQAEGLGVTLADVENIHRRKTAALITASVKIGALLANAPKPQVRMLEQFGERLGLAFQIVDDILDVEGDFETLGKSVGSDDRLAKATYPKVIGLEASKKIAADLIADAKAALEPLSDREVFWQLADYILARQT
jgi:geranylgeranyl diphosphate synthase, type II